MDRQNPFDGFQLNDHFIIHDHVDLVSTLELQSFVRDREIHLAREWQSAKMQFVAEALLISGFEQSRPDLAMDLDRRADDRGSPWVLLVFDFSVSL